MAFVSTLTNFVGPPTHTTASDINAAVDAIVKQVGGLETDGTTVDTGNLDEQNIIAGAGFTNEQKSEPFSWDTVNFYAPSITAPSTDYSLMSGEIGNSGTAEWLTISMFNGVNSPPDIVTLGGTIVVKVNGVIAQTLTFFNAVGGASVIVGSALETTWGWSLGFALNAGDVVTVETEKLTTDKFVRHVSFTLIMKCLHVGF